MSFMMITKIVVGTPTSTTEWDGDLLTIPGMIPGFTEVITVPGPTVAGMIHGFMGTVGGME